MEHLRGMANSATVRMSVIETLEMTPDIGRGGPLAAKNTAYDFLAHCPEKIYHMHAYDNRGVIDLRSILRAAARQGREYIQQARDPVKRPERT